MWAALTLERDGSALEPKSNRGGHSRDKRQSKMGIMGLFQSPRFMLGRVYLVIKLRQGFFLYVMDLITYFVFSGIIGICLLE